MKSRQVTIWGGVALASALVIIAIVMSIHRWRPRTVTLQGAAIRADKDPRRELPIAGVNVTATDGMMTVSATSDASGYFQLRFKGNVWPGQVLQLSFRSPDYEPADMTIHTGLRANLKKLYVAKLSPIAPEPVPAANRRASVISNIRIRYTVNTQAEQNIGSAVRTFQVESLSDVSCNHQGPCSPDGVWRAASGSVTLDAGPGNEFREVRASCIAGPCPFTRIETAGGQAPGRNVTAHALAWAGTATFLLEAEVFRTSINSNVRESYPVIFGRTLNFTLPPTQEGVSIEADLDGAPMVFPLGPQLYLSWASCSERTNREGERPIVYRCELKPGYRF